jgi:hypothetical protein
MWSRAIAATAPAMSSGEVRMGHSSPRRGSPCHEAVTIGWAGAERGRRGRA